MILLYKNVSCPSCKSHHDLWSNERISGIRIRAHDFICPYTGERTHWRPDVFAHLISAAPANAVSLLPRLEDQMVLSKES